MPKRKPPLEVEVQPSVIKWFIQESGWNLQELSKKIKVKQSLIEAWFRGDKRPTLRQLEELSKKLKRPLAAFLLPSPPEAPPKPKDYRMLPGREGEFDKQTLLAIRRARRLQRVSRELSENLEFGLKPSVEHISVNQNPERIADKYRTLFGINEKTQRDWKTPNKAFNDLRNAIEELNIIVLQISMPVEDARGFTLTDQYPTIIVVSLKDRIEARIFSLLHEFGHILLNKTGISMSLDSLSPVIQDPVEKWCNEFAASFLLPKVVAEAIYQQNKETITDSNTLKRLSSRYKVSKDMIMYNMLKLGHVSSSQYQEFRNRYTAELEKVKTNGKNGGGFGYPADKRCFNEKGQKFVSLVLNNIEHGYITHGDAINYLSIKSKNLDKVTAEAKR
jgi:Zn-dependent peptidase ImmA (M78 family)